ncbi:MAG: S24/S26 family peptidase [Bacillota bacterium]
MSKRHILSHELLPIIETTLQSGGTFNLTVSGTSMRPFLTHKTTTVTLAPPTCYKRHNIYLFKTNDQIYLHRLIEIDDETFIFQGDALKQKEMCNLKNIIGQVTCIEKHGKTISLDSPFYRFKIKLWVGLRPFRRILLKLCKG